MIPGMNKINGKVSVAGIYRTGGFGIFWDPGQGFRGQRALRKFLGSKEHLDWLKTDLNAAKIITIQDCKHIKKTTVKVSTHQQS